MPARNSLVIDRPPATPKMMKPMLGGMIGPMIAAEAIRPPERPAPWPERTIIGISSAASAAASATAEPDRLAITQAAKMPTKPRPPFRWPTIAMARLTIRLDSPPSFMISPASMKNGTAIRGKLLAPLMMFWATIWASNRSCCTISATPHRISAKAIGMPIAIEASSVPRKTAMGMAASYRRAPGRPEESRMRRSPDAARPRAPRPP